MKDLVEKGHKLAEVFFGGLGVLMILIGSYAVFGRNILQISTAWTDETLRLLFVWIIFVCSSFAFLSDSLIGLNLVEEKFKDNKKIFGGIKIAQYVCALVLSCFLTIQGFFIVQTQFQTGEFTPVVRYPLFIINAGFLLGSGLLSAFSVYKIIKNIKAMTIE